MSVATMARWGVNNGSLLLGSAPGSGASGYGHAARHDCAAPFTVAPVPDTTSRTTINSRPAPNLSAALAGAEPRLPIGAAVEYHSYTRGQWTPAVVQGFNDTAGTYILDIQPSARPELVRPRGDASSQTGGAAFSSVGASSGNVPLSGGCLHRQGDVSSLGCGTALASAGVSCGHGPPSGGCLHRAVLHHSVSKHVDAVHASPISECVNPAQTPSVTTHSATASLPPQDSTPKLLPSGILVEYLNSRDRWVPAVLESFCQDTGTYKLDIQPYARLGRVRPLQEGATVEYFRASKETWVPAQVTGFNEDFGTYALDIQPFAQANKLRHVRITAPVEGSNDGGDGTQLHTSGNVDAHLGISPASAANVKVARSVTSNGRSATVVNDADGNRLGAFDDKDTIEFELNCDADSLKNWLHGLPTHLLAGLLALLAGEVNKRGQDLKAAEKERDALRGAADYEFFGLDGEGCTDRDVDRAYRKASMELHPDKGGDEAEFNEMRKKYDELKQLRGDAKTSKSGGEIKWEPGDLASMLSAHGDLREQLVWITKMSSEIENQLQELRKGRVRQSLTE